MIPMSQLTYRKKRELLIGLIVGLLLGLVTLWGFIYIRKNLTWWIAPSIFHCLMISMGIVDFITTKKILDQMSSRLARFFVISGLGGIIWIFDSRYHPNESVIALMITVYLLFTGYFFARYASIKEGRLLVKPKEWKFFLIFSLFGPIAITMGIFVAYSDNLVTGLMMAILGLFPILFGSSGFFFWKLSNKQFPLRRDHGKKYEKRIES